MFDALEKLSRECSLSKLHVHDSCAALHSGSFSVTSLNNKHKSHVGTFTSAFDTNMNTSDHDALVSEFCSITQSDPDTVRTYSGLLIRILAHIIVCRPGQLLNLPTGISTKRSPSSSPHTISQPERDLHKTTTTISWQTKNPNSHSAAHHLVRQDRQDPHLLRLVCVQLGIYKERTTQTMTTMTMRTQISSRVEKSQA